MDAGSKAVIASGFGVAGLGELGLFEVLPRGALFMVISGMFAVVLFFVKRDYSRINDSLDGNKKTLEVLRLSIEQNHRDSLLLLADCIKIKDFGDSIGRMYDKANHMDTRLVVLETKSGLRNNIVDPGEPS